jgi:hypothetical protein
MVRGDLAFCFVWSGGSSYYYDNFLPYQFRIDPVPGIHNISGSYRYFKHPRHMNEERAWYASEGFGRGKRSPRNLPDDWDDFQRGDVGSGKSWKNRKIKHQWMKTT